MERVNCAACSRSCAAQARRCLGCGALLAQPAAAPPIVVQQSEPRRLGALVPALIALALVAGAVGFGLRKRAEVRAEEARIAAQPVVTVRAVAPAPRPAAPTAPAVTPAPRAAPFDAAPPRPLPSLPTSFAWYEGANGFRSASDEQRSSGCPMLIYFRTDWCPYCKEFDKEILGDSRATAAIANAVKVRVNPEKGDDEKALAKKFGVHGYPHLLLLGKEGSEPVDVDSGEYRDKPANPGKFAESARHGILYAWDSEAVAHMEAGRLDEAIHDADLLLALEPKYHNGRAYYLRALAFHKKGEFSEALRDYRAGCSEGCASCCNFSR
jgi:thiol-disulfide isomerase/thioredoxin